MSLTLIALTGILVGFLCLVVGFFMDDAKEMPSAEGQKDKKAKSSKKKMVVQRRKVA